MTLKEGRFPYAEGGGLSPISNYSFAENIPVRGINDRTFRFEDVSTSSAYLYLDKSLGNGFEDLLTTDDGISFFPTGQYIRQRALTGWMSSGTFSGWKFYGGTGYLIDNLGLTISGIVSAQTSGFFARSIYQTYGVGFANLNGTGGFMAIQTGIDLTLSGRHQFYGEFWQPVNTGGTPIVMATVVGYSGDGTTNVPICWYNATGNYWSSSVQQANVVPTSNVTGFRFEFYTRSFPTSTPNSYGIWVYMTGTNTIATGNDVKFVVMDDIHIDEFQARNSFSDIIVPTGYLLQITPDLGWHDPLAMFGERQNEINPHLKTYGGFDPDSENLIDYGDKTISLVLSENQLNDATLDNYRRYLWRVIPLSELGPGQGGLPRKFTYLARIYDKDFTINTPEDSNTITKTITGTKSSRTTVIINGDINYPGVVYPSPTSWKVDILMDSPTKVISIQAKDKGGGLSSIKYLTLEVEASLLKQKPLWNVFDDFALLLDIQRLPNENNARLSERIASAMVNPGSPYYQGIIASSCRELGMLNHNDGLSVKYLQSNFDTDNRTTIITTPIGVYVRTDDLIYEEDLLIDPVTGLITLSNVMHDSPISIIINKSILVKESDIEYFDSNSEMPNLRKLKIAHGHGQIATIKYNYYKEYLYSAYPTLGALVVALNNFTDSTGTRLLIFSLNQKLTGSELSIGLSKTQVELSAGNTVSIQWSPIILNKVSDRLFRESFLSDEGTFWNTKFYEYVKQLKSNLKIEWGHILSDKSYWDATDNKLLGFDHVPTICDPAIASYRSYTTNMDGYHVYANSFFGLSGEIVNNKLFKSDHFAAGICFNPDLVPDVYITRSSSPVLSGVTDRVVGQTNNSIIKFFTGSII